MALWSVYEVRCEPSGVRYYARAKDPRRAHTRALGTLQRQRHENPHLQAAWDFYGPDDFTMQVVASGMTEQEAVATVDRLKAEALAADLSFNLAPGEKVHSAEARRRRKARAIKGRDKSARRIVAGGVAYESLSDASRRIGVGVSVIHWRIKSRKWVDYQYASDLARGA